MAQNFNLKGTLYPSFQIGAGTNGPVLYQGTADPSVSAPSGTVKTGDLYLRIGTNGGLYSLNGSNSWVNVTNQSGGSGGGSVTQIIAGTGLTGGTITGSGTIALGTTGVTAGTYTAPTITVDNFGRITYGSSLPLFYQSNSSNTYINLGSVASSIGTNTINIGDQTHNDKPGGVAIGYSAQSYGTSSLAIGSNSISSLDYSVAIGFSSRSNALNTIALGQGAVAGNSPYGNYSIAIGNNGSAGNTADIAIGANAISVGNLGELGTNQAGAIAIGYNAFSYGNAQSIAIGYGATIELNQLGGNDQSIALGPLTNVYGIQSIAIGCSATVGNQSATQVANNAIAIGAGAKALGSNSIVLGYGTASGSGEIVINGTVLNNSSISAGSALSLVSETLNVNADGTTIGINGSNQLYSIPNANYPISSNFSWINQNNAVASDVVGINGSKGIAINIPAQSSSAQRSLFLQSSTLPSTPYSVIAYISPSFATSTDWNALGIFVRNSSTGQFWELSVGANSASTNKVSGNISLYSWTNPTTRNSSVIDNTEFYSTGMWLKIENDGTNLNFFISSSGIEWMEIYSTTIAGFIGAVDGVGILANNNNGTYPFAAGVLNWFVG